MVDVRGDVLRPPHGTTPAAVKSNIKSEMRSFKSNENIHKKEGGSYYVVSANPVASSFRTLGWSSSGPKALEGFKPLGSLITPSLETAISFMKGADLSRSGTWVCSFLLNTSVNWPLNSSAFSRSDWATPFPFFLFRGGIPWVSFFWLLMYR